MQVYRQGGKRVFDLFVAFCAAPFVVPAILLLAALVRFDGGSAFYTQHRVGRNGRLFRCYKLRSMRPDADAHLERLCREDPKIAAQWHRYQKLDHDPRITPLGHFLRASSLDELPQFFNVVKGDMSFVGPRPFLPSQQSLYEAARGRAYFEMRPGITGLWQVSGRGVTSFTDRVRYDQLYHRKLSLGTDLRLMLRTTVVVLRSTGQ
ncbi:sugar transferase [Celeribacter indicus]|nr:sugar transferase [Celeribacter indicus]SDW49645.1 Sugar transferase involved in LPS biosynthesis (colanic, teichoic acid) [Celeribacter indicus]